MASGTVSQPLLNLVKLAGKPSLSACHRAYGAIETGNALLAVPAYCPITMCSVYGNTREDALTVTHTHGKNDNARRTFMLSKRAQKILSDQEELLKQEGVISSFLFPEQNGQHTNQQNMRRAWSRFKKHNGIVAATPYEMRHTFVSVNKDMPEGLKKMVIGHSKDMDTEGTYGHEMQGDMERAAEYIDAAFDKWVNTKKQTKKARFYLAFFNGGDGGAPSLASRCSLTPLAIMVGCASRGGKTPHCGVSDPPFEPL